MSPLTSVLPWKPVSGAFDGETLRLESERFSILLSPEQRLTDGQHIPERRVTRQFSLTSTSLEDEGARLAGPLLFRSAFHSRPLRIVV